MIVLWIRRGLGALVCLGLLLTVAVMDTQAEEPQPTTPIEHIIVLMQSNKTFDRYFGFFPGADGVPADVCMPLDPFSSATDCVEPFYSNENPDLNHSEDTFWLQYNGGRMDGFVYALNQRNEEGRLAMAHLDERDLPYYWNLATEYVLFDRFFSSAHGGSIWNRMYAVAGVPGNDQNDIPDEGFGDIPTIFDRLEARGISWKFYVRNYDSTLNYRNYRDAERGETTQREQVRWVPLLGFDRFIDDPELADNIVDMEEYFEDVQNGTLPAVSYMVGLGATEHPHRSIEPGLRFVRSLLQALKKNPELWSSSAFLLTYDDWGGWYDHVPPPQVDEYGYGFRVPALLVSAYAKQGYVDSTTLDFTSILRFIEDNWELEPLAERDAQANSIASAFDFERPPRPPDFIPWGQESVERRAAPRRAVLYGAYGAALLMSGLIIGWPLAVDRRRDRTTGGD